MADLNKILLIGRVGVKPELHTSAAGNHITNLSVATNFVSQKDGAERKETEWHRVVVHGKSAESCAKYLEPGRLVFVEGRMQSRTWTDRDGNDRFEREVVARRVDFLSSVPASERAAA